MIRPSVLITLFDFDCDTSMISALWLILNLDTLRASHGDLEGETLLESIRLLYTDTSDKVTSHFLDRMVIRVQLMKTSLDCYRLFRPFNCQV